ncbi:MAG: hypothetical protein FWB73_08375 [Treponema sp.]|nr:hypothetical protein [Treponema sp.]
MKEKKKIKTTESTEGHRVFCPNIFFFSVNSVSSVVKFIFILLFLSVPVFAQEAVPWWLSLEYGKQKFRGRDYGAALMLFEDARRDRRVMYELMEKDLIAFLSIGEVRRLGDSLERVEKFAKERYYISAASALDELFYRIPKSSFNNSALAALAAFDKLKSFPEAEYWIGEVYRVEGELPLALEQYRRAYDMRGSLEDPGFAVTLQYKIASVRASRQENNEMETVLLSIINNNDTLWLDSNKAAVSRANEEALSQNLRARGVYVQGVSVPYEEASASFAITGMTRTLENNGINRFLELFRYNNNIAEQAHRLLGFYYVVRGRAAQPHLMFAFLIQNTIVLEEIKKRKYDFTFTTLSALMEEINKSALLLSYINEVEYYKTAYYLGSSLFRNGHTSAAIGLWTFLSAQPQAGEWYNRAVMQLRNPQPEPIVER